jgi:hypothetical protein
MIRFSRNRWYREGGGEEGYPRRGVSSPFASEFDLLCLPGIVTLLRAAEAILSVETRVSVSLEKEDWGTYAWSDDV